MNDMIVDYEGRCYVTGFGYDAATEQPRPVGIVLVQPDGTAQVIDPPLFRPNGCALSEDGRFLWVAETRLHRVTRFAVHPDGRLHSPVVVADLGSGAWADGICLDAEHGLWIGDPKRRRCVRVASDGMVTDSIDTTPYEAVTCVLGGPERRTLFIALSRFDTFTAMARSRRGRIDAVEVAVPGAGLP
jgi:sugar lactone lactonase YvrE